MSVTLYFKKHVLFFIFFMVSVLVNISGSGWHIKGPTIVYFIFMEQLGPGKAEIQWFLLPHNC